MSAIQLLRELFEPELPSLAELRYLMRQELDPAAEFELRQEMWAQAEEQERARLEHRVTPSDRNYQVQVAWRLTRLHLQLTNTLDRTDPLDSPAGEHEAGIEPHKWDDPLQIPRHGRPEGLVATERLVLQRDPDAWIALTENKVPLCPRAADAAGDLDRWLEVYVRLALAIRLPTSAPPAHNYADASRAIQTLFEDPLQHWPRPESIVDYENMLVAMTREQMVEQKHARRAPIDPSQGYQPSGQRTDTADWLCDWFGLNAAEARAAQKHVAAWALAMTDFDVEEARAVDLLRWEFTISEARRSYKNRDAMIALDRISKIRRYSAIEADDAVADFISVVELHSAKRPKRPDPGPPPTLDAQGSVRALPLDN